MFNYIFNFLNVFFWFFWGGNKIFIFFIYIIFFLIVFVIYSNKFNVSFEIWKVDKVCDCNVKVGVGVFKLILIVFFYSYNLERVFNFFYVFLRDMYLKLLWMMVMIFLDNNMIVFGVVWIYRKKGEKWYFCEFIEC